MENNIQRNGGAIVPNGLRAIWLNDAEQPIVICNEVKKDYNEVKYLLRACEKEGI